MQIQEWTKVFKALGNENRLNIIRLLKRYSELPVHDIAIRINLGIKSTSKHLIILSNLGILENHGRRGSVWYGLHSTLDKEIKHIINNYL